MPCTVSEVNQSVKVGETLRGLIFFVRKKDSAGVATPIDLTGDEVEYILRDASTSVVRRWDNTPAADESAITVVPLEGKCTLANWDHNLPPGSYIGEIWLRIDGVRIFFGTTTLTVTP